MKVLVLNGSPHKAGTTDRALSIVEAAMAESGVESERMWIGNRPVRGCIACEKYADTGLCTFTDDLANEIIERLLASDGLVVGTPVYFAGANGALLALLDRVFYAASVHGRRFAGKPACAVTDALAGRVHFGARRAEPLLHVQRHAGGLVDLLEHDVQ